MNHGFCRVGNSPRTHEYNSNYTSFRQEGAKIVRELNSQVGSTSWNSDVNDLNINCHEIFDILKDLPDSDCGPDEICALFLRKTAT